MSSTRSIFVALLSKNSIVTLCYLSKINQTNTMSTEMPNLKRGQIKQKDNIRLFQLQRVKPGYLGFLTVTLHFSNTNLYFGY